MRRGLAVAVIGLFALAGGCASPARYVEKQPDSGIIAIPSNTNAWPSYNRREALALIQKHVGPNYVIENEREVVTGQSTTNNTQVNTDQTANRRFPNLTNERQTATSTTTSQDLTEYRIWYRRVPGPGVNAGGVPGTPGAPNGIVPVGGTQGPPPGVVPSVGPNVQPAGGVPRGRTGPTSYFTPSSRPATLGASDCST